MNPSHAGGVVYRINNASTEYLLVGPSQERVNEWILPKGHIKFDESPEEAALRELREETGVTARIIRPIDTLEFYADEKKVRVAFYLMERISETQPLEKRRRGWFSFEEAVRRATHPETKALLREAADFYGADPYKNATRAN